MAYALPAPGAVIADKYVVEHKLGQGGMGVVYAVRHRITGKRLALKCLLPERAENAQIAARFLREAQAAGRIQHRHVVDVFDVGAQNGLSFIVMEFLEGTSLSHLWEDASITLDEALGIIVRAMEGVAAAHAQGVIHRDLKPDNIFVCTGTSGRLDDPRVLDFGISKFEDGFAPLTSTGTPIGTPYYMSIEQLRGERGIDARVDVYALGVVLYEAIAGRPPYVAANMSVLAIQVLTSEPIRLAVLRPDLPPGLSEVVMKAIARDREDRHPSVRALIEALAPFVSGAHGRQPETRTRLRPSRPPASAATATTASAQPTPSVHRKSFAELFAQSRPLPTNSKASAPVRRQPALWIAAGTALVFMGGSLAWYLLVVLARGPARVEHGISDAPARPAVAVPQPPPRPATSPAMATRPVASEPPPTMPAPTERAASPTNEAEVPEVPKRSATPGARKRGNAPSSKPTVSAPREAPSAPQRTAPVSGRTGEGMALDDF